MRQNVLDEHNYSLLFSKISKNEKTKTLFLICKDVHLRQVFAVEMKAEGLVFTSYYFNFDMSEVHENGAYKQCNNK